VTWPDGVIQLLDDHHLVALSSDDQARRQFGKSLSNQLRLIAETHVAEMEGSKTVDLPSFCRELERELRVPASGSQPSGLHSPGSHAWWQDIQSFIAGLRIACAGPKRRFFIWHDADVMLGADPELFCRIVNAFFGVAAECEHVSLDPLVVMRMVFIGGPKLAAYAEDGHSQFCKWLEDEENSPFWEVMSIVDRPPVIAYRISEGATVRR